MKYRGEREGKIRKEIGMKKGKRVLAGALSALLLTGCQSGRNAEDEALRRQITELESQVAALQQAQAGAASAPSEENGAASAPSEESGAGSAPAEESEPGSAPAEESRPDNVPPEEGSEPGSDTAGSSDTGVSNQAGGSAVTSETMEALTALVDGYTADVDALIAEESADLDRFFSEKQRAEEIDRALDRHEDELERAVRDGALAREDYRDLERKLERLEDRLDDAEDRLEFFFGMDD